MDGLRAVAILSVILYHAFPGILPGGFIGVDIFFVISGFLISSIVFKETQAGKYSHADFYARRIRRIFPALGLVLIITLAAGCVFLFKDELKQLGKHIFAGSIFLSNVLLSREGGYFDGAAETKPLLHLWSLSIEEQFYLFWPLLIVFAAKKKKDALIILMPLMILSFALNIFMIKSNPSAAFYWPLTRFWELLIGSLLAYTKIFMNHTRWPHGWGAVDQTSSHGQQQATTYRNMLSAIGLAAITISFFMAKNSSFPGWWALLPTLGAVALIEAGPQAWINRWVLSSRIAVFIGLISYPLYLWHWPLLVFAKQLAQDDTRDIAVAAAIGAAMVLAFVTYRYVELPIRKSPSMRILPAFLTLFIFLIGLSGLLAYKALLPLRFDGNAYSRIVDAIDDWNYPIGSLDNFKRSENFNSLTIEGRSQDKILFIGDSHIQQYWSRVEFYEKELGHKFQTTVFATYGGCPPLPMVNRLDSGFSCDKFYDYIEKLAQSDEYKTIVIGGFWEGYFGYEYQNTGSPIIYWTLDQNKTPVKINSEQADQIFLRFSKFIKHLVSQHKRVFIILSNPGSPYYNPKSMINRISGHVTHLDVSREAFIAAITPVTDRIIKVANETGASIISPLDGLCDSHTCPAVTKEGWAIYRDGHHIRSSYAKLNAHFLDEVFGLGR